MKHKIFALFMTCIIFLTLFSACRSNKILIVDCSQLEENCETGQRFLSLPESRIVINPFDYKTGELRSFEKLSLSAGYLDPGKTNNGSGVLLEDSLMLLGSSQQKDKPLTKASERTLFRRPDYLSYTARYGNFRLAGKDTFYDRDTVLREIEVVSPGYPAVCGAYNGTPLYNEKTGMFTVTAAAYTLTLGLPANLEIVYYRDYETMAAGTDGSATPEKSGFWRAEFGHVREGDTLRFSLTVTRDAPAVKYVKKALRPSSFSKALSKNEKYWNDFLSRLPHPAEFGVLLTESQTVTEDSGRLAYYNSWIMLASSLTPDKNIYAAKAALWGGGTAASPYSSLADTLAALRLLVYPLPEAATAVYQTILNSAGTDGKPEGGNPPCEIVRTGYAIYQVTGDTQLLSDILKKAGAILDYSTLYPFRSSDGKNAPEYFDAEYVASLLRDIGYFSELAFISGDITLQTLWKNKFDILLADYKNWFFKNGVSYQYYDSIMQKQVAGGSFSGLVALCLPELGEEHRTPLTNAFSIAYKTTAALNNISGVGYVTLSRATAGLIANKNTTEACMIMDTRLRDSIALGLPSQTYIVQNKKAAPGGIRPHIASACMIVDFTLIQNGYMAGEGKPCLVNLFGNATVRNIRYKNKTLNITQLNGDATLTGSLLGRPQTVAVPLNGTLYPDYQPIFGIN